MATPLERRAGRPRLRCRPPGPRAPSGAGLAGRLAGAVGDPERGADALRPRPRQASSVIDDRREPEERAHRAPQRPSGLVSSAVPLSAMRPAAPSPSAVRTMVPTLPGSCTPSSTTTTPPARGTESARASSAGGSITAMTPCGCSVSASSASARSSTATSGTPARRQRRFERRAARSSFQRRLRPRRGASPTPAASASSTSRTPSASASPRRSRPRRSRRSRIRVSTPATAALLTG